MDTIMRAIILASSVVLADQMGNPKIIRIGDRDIPVIDRPAGCECQARVEFAHVQDMSQSFQRVLTHWKDTSEDFANALEEMYPGSRYSLALHVDKPLPYLGYGWGDYNGDYEKDYCYKTLMPFGDKDSFVQALSNLPYCSGGNDLPENQFGAIINAVHDPNLSWSENEIDDDGTIVVKVMSIMTDSVAHGLKAQNKPKKSGGRWPSHPIATRGWALWWTATYWDYSYGKELAARKPGNNSYESWIWPTSSQFRFNKECSYDSGYLTDYEELGDKLLIRGETLTADEATRWEKVKEECAPSNIFEYMGVNDSSAIELHPGSYLPEDKCLKTEYPNQYQVVEALKSKKIVPLMIIPKAKKDHTSAATYYKYVYNCHQDSESGCVEEFYSDAFEDYKVHTATPYVDDDDYTSWMGALFDMVRACVNEACECSTTTTTTTTTTTKMNTTPPLTTPPRTTQSTTTTTVPTTTTTPPTTTPPTTTPPTTTPPPTTTTTVPSTTATPPTTTPPPTTTRTTTTTFITLPTRTMTTNPAPTTSAEERTTEPSTETSKLQEPVCDIKQWVTYESLDQWREQNPDVSIDDIIDRVKKGRCEDCDCMCAAPKCESNCDE